MGEFCLQTTDSKYKKCICASEGKVGRLGLFSRDVGTMWVILGSCGQNTIKNAPPKSLVPAECTSASTQKEVFP